ncbi:MAG: 5-formyltetrahydrofolate cyclo-ligase, partial [Lachnospiraceae bacterium]|nr:5-formyltetrahydrofolate cyclo-ligase [Lachnospiraceae bacterium]
MEKNMSSKQNITDEKRRIRKNVLALRDAMAPAMRTEKSSRIIKRLFTTEAYRSADVILTYVNYQSEVITTALIEHALADKKLVFAPKVAGDNMDFYRITGMNCLAEGYRGILEPSGDEIF